MKILTAASIYLKMMQNGSLIGSRDVPVFLFLTLGEDVLTIIVSKFFEILSESVVDTAILLASRTLYISLCMLLALMYYSISYLI